MLDVQILICIAIIGGAGAGFLSGMLGIGGGNIVVPVVIYLLHKQYGYVEYAQQIAIGTSFLIMAFTSLSNIIAQNKHHNIDWNIFKQLSGIIIIATFLGSILAKFISSNNLRKFFILFTVVLICVNIFNILHKSNIAKKSFDSVQIKYKYLVLGGSLIGVISSLVGVGGGFMTTTLLSGFKLDFKKCIGTSAAIGWPIAITGTCTYLLTGLHVANLPKYTLGFLHLPSFIILTIFTTIFVPIGVKCSTYISREILQILFILLLIFITINMTYSIIK